MGPRQLFVDQGLLVTAAHVYLEQGLAALSDDDDLFP